MKKILLFILCLMLWGCSVEMNPNITNPSDNEPIEEEEVYGLEYETVEADDMNIPVFLNPVTFSAEDYVRTGWGGRYGENCNTIFPKEALFAFKDKVKITDDGEEVNEIRNAIAIATIEKREDGLYFHSDVYNTQTGELYETVDSFSNNNIDEYTYKFCVEADNIKYIRIAYDSFGPANGESFYQYFRETYEFNKNTSEFIQKYVTLDSSQKYSSENDFGDIKRYETKTVDPRALIEKKKRMIAVTLDDDLSAKCLAYSKIEDTIEMYVSKRFAQISDYESCLIDDELDVYRKSGNETYKVDRKTGRVKEYSIDKFEFKYDYDDEYIYINARKLDNPGEHQYKFNIANRELEN